MRRRHFLHASVAILAAGCTRTIPGAASAQRTRPARLPIGFSTLGAPEWTWLSILDFAAANGYTSIELRGLLREMDLTKCPEFSAAQMVVSKQQLAERGVSVTCLGSSANMHEMALDKRAAQMNEARRFIDLAQALGAPYVRVFGNNYVEGVPREKVRAHIAAALRELGDYARSRNVTVLIESHGDFTDSPSLREILERADSPAVAFLWDAHHTFVQSGEAPESTVRELGRWIRHTHLKDSVAAGAERRYVLTGTGDVPVQRQVEALARIGYTGHYSFEWEKRWHPTIEPPEVAFPHFARVAGEYLRAAGVRS